MAQSSSNIPTDVPVVDQANGLVLINGLQEAQRPITELPILTRNLIDPNADYDDVRDASAGQMVRVLATRASQTNYLADGVADTRAGSLGNINTSIFAAWDHIHPIVKISPFATAPTITFSGFTTPVTGTPLAMTYLRSTDETITYFRQGPATIPNTNNRRLFTISNVAGYSMDSFVKTLYRQSVMAGYPGNNTMEAGQACSNYAGGTTTYLYNQGTLPGGIVNITILRVEVTYTLI